ncbi:MAG: hypothetical protein ABI763_15875 [Bacteroidota bacterium]
MKPINDKERTIAYFQFLALSILFIVIWTVAVFFDYKIKAIDYQVLKQENKIIKNNMLETYNLDNQIDSMRQVVEGLSKMTSTDYDDARARFKDGLTTLWQTNAGDSSNLSKIKTGLSKVFMEWYYSIGAKIREGDKNDIIKTDKAEIKELQEKLETKNRDFEAYKESHPG